MNAEQVEAVCSHLSPFLKNTIRTKVLGHKSLPNSYSYGEALIFWIADLLIGNKLADPARVRAILEEFYGRIFLFGEALELTMRRKQDMRQLPICKLGFLDGRLVCMDGRDEFLDLKTGEKVPAVDCLPLETLAYNLATLFVRYNSKLKPDSTRLEPPNG